MRPPFIRNLDSGMRRLGFLEVLICDCVSKGEQSLDKYLGEKLWDWAKQHQQKFLEDLGSERGVKVEVGRITELTASRYVKHATDIGLLTTWSEKQVTDSGRMFQKYRRVVFLVNKNPGQQILLIDALLTRDKIAFTRLIRKLAEAKTISKMEVFFWFAKYCIPEIINEIQGKEDEDLVRRLKDTRQNFLGNRSEKKRGYDLIKHMLDTRLENLVDLGIIDKVNKNYHSNSLTEILNECFIKTGTTRMSLLKSISKYFRVERKATKTQLIKNYIKQYDALATDPIESISIDTLHMCLFIDGIIDQKILFDNDAIANLEELLYKKYYGDVVFLRNRDGKLTHLHIETKIKTKMRIGKI